MNRDKHESHNGDEVRGSLKKESKEETQQLYIIHSGEIQSTQEFIFRNHVERDPEAKGRWAGRGSGRWGQKPDSVPGI